MCTSIDRISSAYKVISVKCLVHVQKCYFMTFMANATMGKFHDTIFEGQEAHDVARTLGVPYASTFVLNIIVCVQKVPCRPLILYGRGQHSCSWVFGMRKRLYVCNGDFFQRESTFREPCTTAFSTVPSVLPPPAFGCIVQYSTAVLGWCHPSPSHNCITINILQLKKRKLSY